VGVVTRRFGALTVHAVRSGFVACKEQHRTLSVPDWLRLPAIVLDRRWTEWMPVTTYVIEHPDGVFVVDAGQREETGDASALDTDPGTRWFYRNLLRLAFRPEERIDRRLCALGIDPARVRGVVLSHRHADHADGVALLPNAAIFVGSADWPSHQGALPAHWPTGRVPTLVGLEGPPLDAFPASTPLASDDVAIVPLGGHSPGHLGVLARAPDGTRLLFAGDATFSIEQVRRNVIAGVCERPRTARRTLALVRDQLSRHATILLPAHERAAFERLGAATPSTITP
jgi:glyoxylase-like metal-dependent hydrolase (beta-lactamase superfamily II)